MFFQKIYKKIPAIALYFQKSKFFIFFQKRMGRLSFFVSKNWKLLLSIFVAFLISDFLLMKSYAWLLPDKELPPLSLARQTSYQKLSPNSYKGIWENNIFHTGEIPLQLEESFVSSDPTLSSLPFDLKGTIIHANPLRSVATISSRQKTMSYQQGDIIEKQAEIKEILRAKVVFFNQNNNRLEYIIIPEEPTALNISYKQDKAKVSSSKSQLIKKTGANQFRVKRSDVNDYLQRLPEILKQARMIPHYENGQIEGFKFASIKKGSIFDELGFQKEDILKEVNGESVRTVEEGLELFDRLKGGSSVKILVQREGKDVYYEYNVNENAPIR